MNTNASVVAPHTTVVKILPNDKGNPLDFEDLSQIAAKLLDDLVLQVALGLELDRVLFRTVAAIGAGLPVRQAVEATVAARFGWDALEVRDQAPQTLAHFVLKVVAD